MVFAILGTAISAFIVGGGEYHYISSAYLFFSKKSENQACLLLDIYFNYMYIQSYVFFMAGTVDTVRYFIRTLCRRFFTLVIGTIEKYPSPVALPTKVPVP